VIAARGSGDCSYYDQNRSGIVIENIGAETLAFIEYESVHILAKMILCCTMTISVESRNETR